MKKNPKILLAHIAESIKAIESHIDGVNKERFYKNIMIQDAVIGRIGIIGEAAKNLPLDFRKKYSAVEWRLIAGARDNLIHEYFGVNLDVVWRTVKKDIPDLQKKIHRILDELED